MPNFLPSCESTVGHYFGENFSPTRGWRNLVASDIYVSNTLLFSAGFQLKYRDKTDKDLQRKHASSSI